MLVCWHFGDFVVTKIVLLIRFQATLSLLHRGARIRITLSLDLKPPPAARDAIVHHPPILTFVQSSVSRSTLPVSPAIRSSKGYSHSVPFNLCMRYSTSTTFVNGITTWAYIFT